jgi:hypothetical protein
MWEKVRITAMGVTAFVVWFTVVTLGFGSQLWPLVAGVH